MGKSILYIKFENNLQEILELYWKQNVSIKEIASRFGFGASTLQKFMSKLHLLRRQGESSRKYEVDENYFENIDTEQKAYWLGVLYADGCIMHIKNTKYIVFSSVDEEWLEQYKKSISYTGPIKKEHHKKYDKDIYKVKCVSKKMYNDLMNKGIVEAKSKVICFPDSNIVPIYLLPHFVRGYFDGDGSVGVYQNLKNESWKRLHVSFSSGSYEFLNGLREWLIQNGVNPIGNIRKPKNREVYLLDMSLIGGTMFRDLVYKDATIYLQRKHDVIFSVDYCKRTFNDYNRVSFIEDKGIVCSHAKV